jgi:methylphosphotriester-DNA--protein-cysteine methyltransferase
MTTQTENKIRIRKAADHILKGHSAQATVAVVAETEGVSRRTARRHQWFATSGLRDQAADAAARMRRLEREYLSETGAELNG